MPVAVLVALRFAEGARRPVESGQFNARSASGLAENGDIGWIATEPGDIVLDPSQRGDLVEDAAVVRAPAMRAKPSAPTR